MCLFVCGGLELCIHANSVFKFLGFLSSQMVDMQLDKALIFEDDVRFQPNFKRRVLRLMEEVEQVELDWDMM